MRKTLRTGSVEWSYLDTGEGDELWLTFHGYAQEGNVMQHFMKTFRPNARVLSFDLPLHGKTIVEKPNSVAVENLVDLQQKVLFETGAKECSVLGFSLGGKLVLKMVETVPKNLSRVVLIAPDGLRMNPLYWLVTNTLIGRWIFHLVILFPQPFLAISKLLATTRLMNPRIHGFVAAQMGTETKRQKVLDSWLMFRNLTPSLKKVRNSISHNQIEPTLVFGKRDRVIHPKLSKKLSGKNCKTAQVIMLDAGHNLTTKEVALKIRNQIQ